MQNDNDTLKVLRTQYFPKDGENIEQYIKKFKNEMCSADLVRSVEYNLGSEVIFDSAESVSTEDYVHSFDRFRKLNKLHEQVWVDALMDVLAYVEDKKINLLDIGSGTGRFSIPFSRITADSSGRAIGIHITGVDKSQEMNKIAMLNASNDIHNLEFKNINFGYDILLNKYDIIFVSDVLHLVSDRIRFFGMLNETLKNNGIVIFRIHDHSDLVKLEWLNELGLVEEDKKRSISKEKLKALAMIHGFSFFKEKSVDESTDFTRADYFEMLSSRAYSILRLLDNNVLIDKINDMQKKNKNDLIHNTCIMSMICFKKHDEWYVPME